MSTSDEFIRLIARAYYEAALENINMRNVTDILEAIRNPLVEGQNYLEVWEMIDQYIGQTEVDNLQKVLIKFRNRFVQQVLTSEIARLREAFRNNPEFGWTEWLRTYVDALTYFRIGNFCLALSKERFQFPAGRESTIEKIRKSTKYASHARWSEAYDMFIYLTKQEFISNVQRAKMCVTAAEIQLYHLLNLDVAKDLLQQGEELAPGESRVLYGWGEYWLQKNELDTAKEYFQEVIRQDPLESLGYTSMGDCYEHQNDLDAAEEWYLEAIKKSGGNYDGYISLLRLYGRPEMLATHESNLLPLLKRAIIVDPTGEYNAYTAMGYIYQQSKQYEKARNWYDRAIELDDTRLDGYISKGIVYIDEKNYEEAENELLKALRFEPENQTVLRTLHDFAYDLKFSNAGTAIRVYDKIRQIIGESYEADYHFNLAKVYEMLKDWAKAREEIKIAFEDKNEDVYRREMAFINNAEGNQHFEYHRFQEAIKSYREAILWNPTAIYYSNLAGAWENLKAPGNRIEELENAISALHKAFELEPENKEYADRLKNMKLKKKLAITCGEPAFNYTPILIPIAVEVAHDLLPYILSGTNELSTDFIGLINTMRNRIRERFGVRMPGIKFRGDPSISSSYVFILMEIPIASGRIAPDKKFFPGMLEELTALEIAGEEAFNSPTGIAGYWIAQTDWEKAKNGGLVLCEVNEYILRHLEAVLQKNLVEFVGHQEVMSILGYGETYDNLKKPPERFAALIEILKRLVREEVPITSLNSICNEFTSLWAVDMDAMNIVERLRSLPEILPALPGNNDRYSFYQLSKRFEVTIDESISEENILSLEPETAHNILKAVRDKVGSEKHAAILVEKAELRPFIKRLIEYEFPNIPILSRQELLPGLEGKVIGVIDLAI